MTFAIVPLSRFRYIPSQQWATETHGRTREEVMASGNQHLSASQHDTRCNTRDELRRLQASNRGSAIYFYFLLEPDANVVRYIGQSVNVSSRYNDHILSAHRCTTPCAKWIAGLIDARAMPRVQIVGSVRAVGMENALSWHVRAARAVERDMVRTIGSSSHGMLSGYEFDLLNVEHTLGVYETD